MIPPKYKYYVGKAVLFGMRENTNIDNSNGQEISSAGYCASYSIYVNSLTIYINTHPIDFSNIDTNRIYIHCYNGSMYLGYTYTTGSEIVMLKDNTTSIRLSFKADNIDIYSKINNNINAVYIISNINPHYKQLNKKYSKESSQEFFRVSLDGKIVLYGNDYEIIKNSDLDDSFIFIINKYSINAWAEYYKGEFTKVDCKFDYDKKSCELKTTVLDDYNKVMSGYENTYDIIKLAPAITKINLYKRSLIQVYIQGSNSITNFFGGTYWEGNVNRVIDDYNALIHDYYFSYIRSGNEFEIKGSSLQGVNGVYAGNNGSWQCWNGFSAYAQKIGISGITGKIIVKRNSDNKDLYQTNIININFYPNDVFFTSYVDINMTAIEGNGIVSDTCIISNVFAHRIFQRLLCDVDTVTDSQGVKNTYNLPQNDFVADNRNYKKCIGLRGGLFFCTSRTVEEPTKYGLNDYGRYFTNRFLPLSSGLGRPLPISRNSWANASLWYIYDDLTYTYFEEQLRKQYVLKDSYSIASVISVLLKKINPILTHEATPEYSRFLYDSSVPIYGMSRFYVFITQKTNILKGNYDQAAQKAETSLKNIMEMLRDCFRCYWYIEDNKFKIEHISFFMNGKSYSNQTSFQLDFTKAADQFNKKLVQYFQSAIEYIKDDLNQRYEFSWMDDVTELFGNVSIDVKSNYIQKDKNEEISINQFSSDIDYMIFNPSNFSEDGFALLCPVKNDSIYELPVITTRLIDENGDSYSATVQNWYASWAYLVNFYMYDMPAYNIECSILSDLYVADIKKCMEHTIEVQIEEDLDEYELIKTNIGNGKIDEYSVNMNTRVAKVKLVYKPR